MVDIVDFQKFKKKVEQEEENFTYAGYIQDLEAVRQNYHLLSIEDQHTIFMQTSHLLIEMVKSAIKNEEEEGDE